MAAIDNPETLQPKEDLFLAALLAEPTISAAAKAAGIGERTAFRYLQDPAFQEAYREARRQTVSHAIKQIQAAAAEAVDTLRAVMSDPAATSSSRVSAAKTVMDMALKATEIEDISERLERLEELAEQSDQRAA